MQRLRGRERLHACSAVGLIQQTSERCLEVGSGSGYVTCSIAMLLRKAGYYAHCIAVDVSPSAADATQCTLEAHSVRILQSCHILP